MATTLTGTVTIKHDYDYRNPDSANLAAPVLALVRLLEKTFSSGTGDNQVNRLYVAEVSVSGAGSTTLDLAGSLTDVFGQTITLAKLKVLHVLNQAVDGTANAADCVLTIGNATNPVSVFGGAAHTLALDPGDVLTLVRAKGISISGGSTDELKLANAGSTTAKVVVIVAGSTS